MHDYIRDHDQSWQLFSYSDREIRSTDLRHNPWPAYFYTSVHLMYYLIRKTLSSVLEVYEGGRDLSIDINDPETILDAFTKVEDKFKTSLIGKEINFPLNQNNKNALKTMNHNYNFYGIDIQDNRFEKKMVYEYKMYKSLKNTDGTDWYWPNDNMKPPDIPKCGFNNERCYKMPLMTKLLYILTSSCFIILIAYVVHAYFKLQKSIHDRSWKISYEDIIFSVKALDDLNPDAQTEVKNQGHSKQKFSHGKTCSSSEDNLIESCFEQTDFNKKKDSQAGILERAAAAAATAPQTVVPKGTDEIPLGHFGFHGRVGLYKDKVVAVKPIPDRERVIITKQLEIEFKYMKEIHDDHLTKFIGAVIDAPNICILREYCQKGSLNDMLNNSEMTLEFDMQISFAMDLAKGLLYLHNSPIKSHGQLKSTNCLIDGRLVLKITDYGLPTLRGPVKAIQYVEEWENRLATSPELLNLDNPPICGSQKGDIYSFGIILQELLMRKGPFFIQGSLWTSKEIVNKVRKSQVPLTRPTLDQQLISDEMAELCKKCWSQDADKRPDAKDVKKILDKYTEDHKIEKNLVLNLMGRMVDYSNVLEGLVNERTQQYFEEKKRADDLLEEILPPVVADQLKKGRRVPAEAFKQVTIFFSDIVGFTELSSNSTPIEIVDMLNDLYTAFDRIVDDHDVYKVETIGDAYMLVSGLPVRNGNKHAYEIAKCALSLSNCARSFKIHHRPEAKLKLRIGIHSGPCVAGIVGIKMPRYCLFGDTVNTASRMESTGEMYKIHISNTTKNLLDEIGGFDYRQRDPIEVKGKGMMQTYWLIGCGEGLRRRQREEARRKNTASSMFDHRRLSAVDPNGSLWNDSTYSSAHISQVRGWGLETCRPLEVR